MTDYYARVAAYFDQDAAEFESRYWLNPVAQRMRQLFREEVKRLPFRSALEIGCGTGLDLAHFGRIYPERDFLGVDVSEVMVGNARDRLERAGLPNADALVASVEAAPTLRGPAAFDLCYSFFGALNTVPDVDVAARRLYEATRPGGHLVLTFVNRWYVVGALGHLARGRWGRAFRRLRDDWDGYNPERPLPSRCLSPARVDRAFGGVGTLCRRAGLSILHPPWYWAHWVRRLGRVAPVLWELDRWLNRTPAWSLGEYALYVYRKAA